MHVNTLSEKEEDVGECRNDNKTEQIDIHTEYNEIMSRSLDFIVRIILFKLGTF